MLPEIKEKMAAKHERMIALAAKKKVQVLGLQELDEIQEARAAWQFFRDRRPESYGETARTGSSGPAQAASGSSPFATLTASAITNGRSVESSRAVIRYDPRA